MKHFFMAKASAFPPAGGQSGAPCNGACQQIESAIFPQPQEISNSGSNFALDNQVRVVVPSDASEQDLLLAGMLVNELSDGLDCF